jgi:hypothetical protein
MPESVQLRGCRMRTLGVQERRNFFVVDGFPGGAAGICFARLQGPRFDRVLGPMRLCTKEW